MNVNGMISPGAKINGNGRTEAAGTVDGLNGAAAKNSTRKMKGQDSLTMDDFLRLIAIQLQNQDMSNPMDNSEMMNQLVQMATVEAMSSMTTQVSNSYATGLLGQQVDVLYPNGNEMQHDAGVVTGINMSTYPPTIYLDDKKDGYPMSTIAFIGQNKLEDGEDGENPDGPGDTAEPEGPGDTAGSEASDKQLKEGA